MRFKWDDPELFEGDLSRDVRVLTDLYLDDDTPSTGHVILKFDIENDTTGGFCSPMVADRHITAIANHLSTTDHYTVFLLDEDGKVDNRTVGDKTIVSCRTEDELLTRWLQYYKDAAPTIITHWNGDSYDVPFVYNRLLRVYDKKTAESLSPVGIVRYNNRKEVYEIAGVSSLDYLKLYKKFTLGQRPSYRLDAIGKAEVGMGKVEYEGTLDTLFKNDIEKFLDYNLNDVEIIVALDKKMKLIELARMICHMGHCSYENFESSSRFIEGTLVTYLHRNGLIVPNKVYNGEITDEVGFVGAFVKEPVPGVYDWVYSTDLASLYPSIIMSLNISSETRMGKILNWDATLHAAGKLDTYEVQLNDKSPTKLSREDAIKFLNTKNYMIASNGVLYRSDVRGFIPVVIEDWFNRRKEYKNLMKKFVKDGNNERADFYDLQQQVMKVLCNSVYGVLGLKSFRFYNLDNASAVTSTGQDVIKTSAKFVNHLYKKKLSGVK